MCTVTYLPTEKGCLISSNRDEIITRSIAELPQCYVHGSRQLLYPRDPVGGGTWILTAPEATICLFNGGFKPHVRREEYRISRGLIPIRFFDFLSIDRFAQSFDFQGIEPFSLVVYQEGRLHYLVWDEQRVHLKELDAKTPKIWASSTLYSPEVQARRDELFEAWLGSHPSFNQASIMAFHTSEDGDSENGLLINRANGLKTVSVTSIERNDAFESSMVYRDLINNVTASQAITF